MSYKHAVLGIKVRESKRKGKKPRAIAGLVGIRTA